MSEQVEKILAFDDRLNLIEIERKLTRAISGSYYIPGKSCIKMENSYHRINNGKIYFNHATEEWQFGNSKLALFISNFTNGKINLGFTSKLDKLNTLDLSGNIPSYLIKPKNYHYGIIYNKIWDLLDPLSQHYIEEFTKDRYLDKRIYISKEAEKKMGKNLIPYNKTLKSTFVFNIPEFKIFSNVKGKNNEGLIYSKELQYSISESKDYSKEAKKQFAANQTLGSEFDELYDRYFSEKSFGLEIETLSGQIAEEDLLPLGFVPLRDGSIRGGIEYTSIPFNSGKGIAAVRDFYYHIQEQCTTHQDCSLHFHIGGFERSKLNALTLYILCYRLQEELFDIVPIYKKELRYWSSKRELKDHCQSLKSLNINIKGLIPEQRDRINEEFQKLFMFLTEGHVENENYNFRNKNFPKKGSRKWNLHSRYFFINFIPYIFFDQETIEFRIFESSLDFETTLNYLLISNSIIKFVELYGQRVRNGKEKITLESIIDEVYGGELANSIIKFINKKRANNSKDYIEANIYGEIDRQNHKYEFGIDTPKIRKELEKLQLSPISTRNPYMGGLVGGRSIRARRGDIRLVTNNSPQGIPEVPEVQEEVILEDFPI